jgi:GTP-binding protein
MSLLHTARFHTTVAQARQLPQTSVAEVAFIGRSNAGKSSAINVLCQRRRLAFASNTPGRTQALNYFAVGREEAIDGFLVDMPGYGYAAAPGGVRATWDALAGRYLHERGPLRAAVLMLDIRRRLTERDGALLDWLGAQRPLLVLLTKSDKLGTAEQAAARRAVLTQLAQRRGHARDPVILFSATTRRGVDDARAVIEGWIRDAEKKNPD